MSLGNNKASVLAIVPEVTEGTPVDPTAATDYLALQPDVSLTPSFEQLDNEEIRASIGKAKSIQGLERPEMSFSHYLKHSGVEGQKPEISDLLKSAFGTETVNATERLTAGGGTVSNIVLASGGGDFARGFAVLVKNTVYEIRPIFSVSGNNLTPLFNLASAPGTGQGVGKCINYSPANSGHQSLSAWLYRGGGHAIEQIAGGKVTEFGFSASAGELINSSFSLVGKKYHFNPVRISATDTKLDFTDDDGTFVATIEAKLYRTPLELARALASAMNAANPGETHSVSYSVTTGKYTISSTGAVLSLLWNTGANTANTVGDKIGFSTAADDTGSLSYTSDNESSYASPFAPTLDSADPNAAKFNEVFLGDATDNICFCVATIDFTLANERTEVPCVCEESGVNAIIITDREVTVRMTALLEKHQAGFFDKFANNTELRWSYSFGPRLGGNWVAGKCGNANMPSAVISDYELTDLDSVIALDIEVKAFVDRTGSGEVYLNFL